MTAAIALNQVVKRFGAVTAVDHVSFEIEQGSIVALLGPNGAGKTTTISMMLGLSQPTSGSVLAFGQDPAKRLTRKHYGVMLQQVGLPGKVKVRELIDLFRSFYDHPLDAERLLAMAGLESEARKEAVKLSGGQQRRLQFALAMAGNPKLLFLDEPTTGMDVTSRRGFWDSLREFARDEQRTIVLTTHHLDEADAMADRILLMQHGRVIADGSVEDVKRQSGKRYVSFIAGASVTEEVLATLPLVDHVEWSGRHVRLTTTDPDTLLRAIIQMDLDVSHFEVSQGRLEDAFVSLTGSETWMEEAVAHDAMVVPDTH
ncbi:ABC transporter ATP-binding protein [Alicyclobacillus acidiphilus]|uniref:ABC transporter ATP-binding protein n=1 Tax=Alicyclobacillus acidiphilus TaxID=182455 RepID=UPI0008328663|nr:ABC transporter ATP-binding protein [Alicyclobacillus acidiphilus]